MYNISWFPDLHSAGKRRLLRRLKSSWFCGAFSVNTVVRDVPGQESLPTSPSGHTTKVSGRRDAMWMRQQSLKGIFISTDSAWQWVSAAPLTMPEVRFTAKNADYNWNHQVTMAGRVKNGNVNTRRREQKEEEEEEGARLTWHYSHRWGQPGQQWKQEGKR